MSKPRWNVVSDVNDWILLQVMVDPRKRHKVRAVIMATGKGPGVAGWEIGHTQMFHRNMFTPGGSDDFTTELISNPVSLVEHDVDEPPVEARADLDGHLRVDLPG